MSHDPPRLADASDDPALRDALRAARDVAPDAAQIERMRQRLPRGAPPTGGDGASPWRRAWPVVGVAGAALVAAALARSPASSPPLGPPAVVPRPASVEVVVAPPPAAPPPPAVPPPATAARVEAPHPPPIARARVAHPVATSPTPAPALATVCDEAEETERLQRAQGALRAGRWSDALTACADDGRVCARGPLSEERERLWIEALARSGRDAEARARWGAFRRLYPDSSHGERLRALWPDDAP
jgi:hypothetical protein